MICLFPSKISLFASKAGNAIAIKGICALFFLSIHSVSFYNGFLRLFHNLIHYEIIDILNLVGQLRLTQWGTFD